MHNRYTRKNGGLFGYVCYLSSIRCFLWCTWWTIWSASMSQNKWLAFPAGEMVVCQRNANVCTYQAHARNDTDGIKWHTARLPSCLSSLSPFRERLIKSSPHDNGSHCRCTYPEHSNYYTPTSLWSAALYLQLRYFVNGPSTATTTTFAITPLSLFMHSIQPLWHNWRCPGNRMIIKIIVRMSEDLRRACSIDLHI